MFNTAEFQKSREGQFGSEFYYFADVESTNQIAARPAKEDCPEGTVILAESQSKGRGRKQSYWFSPPDVNLYFSIVLRPEISLLRYLPFVPSLSLIRSLAKIGIVADLKWPNDLLVHDKKISGILIETALEENILKFAIVGIGINLNLMQFPRDLVEVATSAFQCVGHEISRESFLSSYLLELEQLYGRIGAMEWSDFALELEKNSSYLRGCPVRIVVDGSEFEGTTEGLDTYGGLIVSGPEGRKVFHAGEVVTCRKK